MLRKPNKKCKINLRELEIELRVSNSKIKLTWFWLDRRELLEAGLEFPHFRGKATWPVVLRAQRPKARAARP